MARPTFATFGTFQPCGRVGIVTVIEFRQRRITVRVWDELKEEAADEGHEEGQKSEQEE